MRRETGSSPAATEGTEDPQRGHKRAVGSRSSLPPSQQFDWTAWFIPFEAIQSAKRAVGRGKHVSINSRHYLFSASKDDDMGGG